MHSMQTAIRNVFIFEICRESVLTVLSTRACMHTDTWVCDEKWWAWWMTVIVGCIKTSCTVSSTVHRACTQYVWCVQWSTSQIATAHQVASMDCSATMVVTVLRRMWPAWPCTMRACICIPGGFTGIAGAECGPPKRDGSHVKWARAPLVTVPFFLKNLVPASGSSRWSLPKWAEELAPGSHSDSVRTQGPLPS